MMLGSRALACCALLALLPPAGADLINGCAAPSNVNGCSCQWEKDECVATAEFCSVGRARGARNKPAHPAVHAAVSLDTPTTK